MTPSRGSSHGTPSELSVQPHPHRVVMARLARLVWNRGHRGAIAGSLLFLLLGKVLTLTVPFLLKYAVDALTLPSAQTQSGIEFPSYFASLPVAVIIAYGAAQFLARVANELRDFTFARTAYRTQKEILVEAFAHLMDLPLEFHLSRKTGEISRILERGTRSLQFIFQFMTFNIIPTLLEVSFVTLILAWHFPPIFPIITFATVIIYVAFTISVTEWRTKFRRDMNRHENEGNSRAIDSLINYETVKYFGNETLERERLFTSLTHYENSAVMAQRSMGYLNGGQGGIIALGLVLMMGYAAKGVVQGSLTIGDFVLINTFLLQLYTPLNFLGFVYREIKQGLIDLDQLFFLLDKEKGSLDQEGARPLTGFSKAIRFDQVSFAYGTGREVLKNVSFEVPQGHTVALVGPSGGGKSTIARLLFRFYAPTTGAITIDGEDISSFTTASTRNAIGVVPQDSVLFNETVRYNVLYGNTSATPEEVERALQLARADTFVRQLPQGLATMVGERGLKLSGGEKQRIALARALLKNPRIFLFDEATSSLDSQTEAEIQEALNDVSKGRTTLVIAHRLSTVVSADEILVLQDGTIAERGTHLHLLAADGIYAKLWRTQQQEEELVSSTPPKDV